MTTKNINPDQENFGDYDPRIGYNRVWFNLMRLHRNMMPPIAAALRREGVNDPIWYEILLTIESAGSEGHMMGELEDKLFLPQYALSRHISRLVKAGLLRREYVADGRRKQRLFVTEKGMGLHQRIWPTYVKAIQAEIAPRISTDEAYSATHMLMRILYGKEPGDDIGLHSNNSK
nr:MarR family transcriptional regulator [uncultured Roseovarius sp.]